MGKRGNYRDSQELDAYERRRAASFRMDGSISPSGVLLFGKYKGSHLSEVPADYLKWADESIAGFAERRAVFARRPKPKTNNRKS